jgi:hypothetical protein
MTKAKDVKAGFKTEWWTAERDAVTFWNPDTRKQETVIAIKYNDGGNGKRVFDPEQYVGTGSL